MIRTLVLSVTFALVIGCGGSSDEKPKAAVSGTVQLDGKPMDEGDIYFIEPGNPPDIVQIRDGTFSGEVTVGPKKIQINKFKAIQVRPFPDAPPEDSQINLIHPKFNAQTTFEEDVQEDKENKFEFSVTSIKK